VHPDGPALSTDPTFLVLRLLSLISLSSSVGRRLVLSSCREAIGLENRSALLCVDVSAPLIGASARLFSLVKGEVAVRG